MTEELKAYIERLIQEEVRPTLAEQAAALMRATQENGEFLREQWKHCSTREERWAEAEQRAWDRCVAACLSDSTVSLDEALTTAEGMLLERRKRFGAGKEPQLEPGKVAVPRELLLKCIAGLRGDVPELTRHLFADDLRALVSE